MYRTTPEKQRWFGMDRDHVVLGLLAAILVTALVLRLWRLGAYGYGNEYYAAAVKSMLQSWKNFFFIAAEPGGSVMVDKPPLGLWLQTISAAIFGVNGFALALPSALAGTLSVYIVYLMVKAIFNHHAALASAFFLAVLPGVVWVDRTNLLDSMVMCACLVAVWLMMNAILQKQWLLLVASFAVIGLGFNIKMLQAYLILPAMGIVYFLSAKDIWWQRLLHLSLATLVMVAISFSWVLAVDLTSTENRPYVSSTETNSMMELVFGHNGVNRLINIRDQIQFGLKEPPGTPQRPERQPAENPNTVAGVAQGHGVDEIGKAGIFRLFRQPLAHQVSWLLGFALIALVLVPFFLDWQFPLEPQTQLYLLFGIWLLTEVIFFSFADFFHAYYLLMLGAPITVMCGMGLWAIIQLWDQESWKGFAASIVVVVSTVLFNTTVLVKFGEIGQSVKILSGLIAVVAIIGVVLCTVRKHCIWRNVALMGVVVFLGTASFLWTAKGIAAEDRTKFIRDIGSSSYISITYQYGLTKDERNLLTFLEENTEIGQPLMMVEKSNMAAPFVLESGRAVFTTGGFTGKDPVVTDAEIIEMLSSGDIHFVFPPMDRSKVTPPLARFYQRQCEVRVFGDTVHENTQTGDQRPPMTLILDCRKSDQ